MKKALSLFLSFCIVATFFMFAVASTDKKDNGGKDTAENTSNTETITVETPSTTDNKVPATDPEKDSTSARTVSDSDPFITHQYDVTVNIRSLDTFDFTETIEVTFNEARRGIYLTKPITGQTKKTVNGQLVTSDYELSFSDIRVEGHPFNAYKDGDTQVIKIGDPNHSFVGPARYVVHYQCRVIKSDGSNQFYWNLLPTEWEVPIENAKTVVVLPKSIDKNSVSFHTELNYSSTVIGNTIIADLEEPVTPGTGLTIMVIFPDNYFSP